MYTILLTENILDSCSIEKTASDISSISRNSNVTTAGIDNTETISPFVKSISDT